MNLYLLILYVASLIFFLYQAYSFYTQTKREEKESRERRRQVERLIAKLNSLDN